MRVIQEITADKIGRIIDEFVASDHKEEEKKMLNVDKYREKIEKLNDNSLRCGLAELRGLESCEGVECGTCATDSLHWLVKKYEPPLLKNGDGLKPGGWIMVKDPDDRTWVKKIFAYYCDGYFYCANDIAFFKNGLLIKRKQARLPEDGE